MFFKKIRRISARVGTPVQFYRWNSTEWSVHPALISYVNGNDVNIQVFPSDEGSPFIATRVRHEDVKQEGDHYWAFLK